MKSGAPIQEDYQVKEEAFTSIPLKDLIEFLSPFSTKRNWIRYLYHQRYGRRWQKKKRMVEQLPVREEEQEDLYY